MRLPWPRLALSTLLALAAVACIATVFVEVGVPTLFGAIYLAVRGPTS